MKAIAEDIKNGDFKPVYLLYGEEGYMRSEYLKRLLFALGASEDSMNFTRFEGKRINDDEVIETCETLPFFFDRRVVLIEDSDIFKEKHEKLSEYMARIPEYMTLIFSAPEIDKRGKLYKAAAAYGRAVEFKTLGENEIIEQVLLKLKRSGKKIRRSTMNEFLSGAGSDMSFISCELEKLIAYAGDAEEITLEDIRAVCHVRIETKIFDMIADTVQGKRSRALKSYGELLALKEAPVNMLAKIERQYRELLNIKELYESGQGDKLIAAALGISPYAVKKNLPIAKKYSTKQLKEILKKAARLDEEIKEGRIGDSTAVEMLLIAPDRCCS